MKKYGFQLLGFAVLLGCVPILLLSDQLSFAKVVGLVVVLATAFAIRYWLYTSGKLKSKYAAVKLNANDKFYLDTHLPIYKGMDGKSKKQFHERLGRLLGEIDFDCEREGTVSRDEGVAFASLIAVNTFSEEYKSYKGKIVVFTKTSPMKLFKQEQRPVLMVSLSDLEAALHEITALNGVTLSHTELQENLRNFNDLAVG